MRLTRRAFACSVGGLVLGVPLLTRRVRADDDNDDEWVEDLDVEADLEVAETIALGEGELPENEELAVAVTVNFASMQLASVKDIDPKLWRLGGTDVTKAPPSLSSKVGDSIAKYVEGLFKANAPALGTAKTKLLDAVRASGKVPWKNIDKLNFATAAAASVAISGAIITTPVGLALGAPTAVVAIGLKAYKDARK